MMNENGVKGTIKKANLIFKKLLISVFIKMLYVYKIIIALYI